MPGFLLLFIVALFVFGPNKLPEIGRATGKALREFKEATKNILNDNDER